MKFPLISLFQWGKVVLGSFCLLFRLIISFVYKTEDICAKCFCQDYDLRIGYPSMTACQSLVEWSQRHGGPVDIVIRPWLALGPFFLAQPCSKSLHPVCRSCQCLFPFLFWSQFLHLQYGSLTANGFLWRTTMMTTCSGLPHVRETVASLLSLVAAAVVEPQFF